MAAGPRASQGFRAENESSVSVLEGLSYFISPLSIKVGHVFSLVLCVFYLDLSKTELFDTRMH